MGAVSDMKIFCAAITLTIVALLLSGCPKPANGGGAGGSDNGASPTPDVKLEVPSKLKKRMDFPASFTVVELEETRTTVYIVYTVYPARTQEIAQMIIADLGTRGYRTDDNPSRILEGVSFTGGELREIFVKVTEEYDRGTVVTLDVKI